MLQANRKFAKDSDQTRKPWSMGKHVATKDCSGGTAAKLQTCTTHNDRNIFFSF